LVDFSSTTLGHVRVSPASVSSALFSSVYIGSVTLAM
jgi:hypothetical protein